MFVCTQPFGLLYTYMFHICQFYVVYVVCMWFVQAYLRHIFTMHVIYVKCMCIDLYATVTYMQSVCNICQVYVHGFVCIGTYMQSVCNICQVYVHGFVCIGNIYAESMQHMSSVCAWICMQREHICIAYAAYVKCMFMDLYATVTYMQSVYNICQVYVYRFVCNRNIYAQCMQHNVKCMCVDLYATGTYMHSICCICQVYVHRFVCNSNIYAECIKHMSSVCVQICMQQQHICIVYATYVKCMCIDLYATGTHMQNVCYIRQVYVHRDLYATVTYMQSVCNICKVYAQICMQQEHIIHIWCMLSIKCMCIDLYAPETYMQSVCYMSSVCAYRFGTV